MVDAFDGEGLDAVKKDLENKFLRDATKALFADTDTMLDFCVNRLVDSESARPLRPGDSITEELLLPDKEVLVKDEVDDVAGEAFARLVLFGRNILKILINSSLRAFVLIQFPPPSGLRRRHRSRCSFDTYGFLHSSKLCEKNKFKAKDQWEEKVLSSVTI